MNSKKLICLGVFLIVGTIAIAQRQNVYFLKNSGQQVSTRDSADFIRIVSEPDSGTQLYNVKEYFTNGKPKLIGKSSKINPPVFEGQCITFFPSGKRKEFANFKNGHFSGDVYTYFPNGKLYTAKQYINVNNSRANDNYLIEACNDSTGKELVADGNGYYVGYDNDFKNVFEEGNVKAGLKNGDWKGKDEDKYNTIIFTEKYDNGKMISGHAIDKSKHEYEYTQRQIEPMFTGGEIELDNFLSSRIVYPAQARKNRIAGKVYLTFVIEKDGTLTDIKIVKNPNDALSNEAVRVLNKSPKWTPGMMYGRNVRVQYTLPVNFSLD